MWNKLFSLVAFITIITVNQALAAAPCLDDVTDAAKDLKACLVEQSTSNDCGEQSRQLEIKKLICERDGADKRNIQLSVDIGNLMIAGDLEDAPITEVITKAVVTEINSRLDGKIDDWDAALAATERRLLQVAGDMKFLFSVERDERTKLAADLSNKINQATIVQGSSSELERRIRTIEERLKAIDASRAALNAELLKVQGQVNGLMLDRTVRK